MKTYYINHYDKKNLCSCDNLQLVNSQLEKKQNRFQSFCRKKSSKQYLLIYLTMLKKDFERIYQEQLAE